MHRSRLYQGYLIVSLLTSISGLVHFSTLLLEELFVENLLIYAIIMYGFLIVLLYLFLSIPSLIFQSIVLAKFLIGESKAHAMIPGILVITHALVLVSDPWNTGGFDPFFDIRIAVDICALSALTVSLIMTVKYLREIPKANHTSQPAPRLW